MDERDEKLVERTCAGFVDVVAAKAPVPGGGGVAALAGALGAALCSMVGEYTVGKARYADVQDDVERMLAEGADVRARLLALVDEDAAAFEPLSRAYAVPRDDPSRDEVLEEATKGACAAPLEIMRQCARAIALLEEMGEKGSRMLLSDVGCGAYLAVAALRAASLNVFVNTGGASDRAWAAGVEAEADELLATWVPRGRACADRVTDSIRKRG